MGLRFSDSIECLQQPWSARAARRAPDYLLTLLEDPPDYGELEAEA